MRKRIAVFGGSLFQDIRFENNRYVTTNKQTTIRLAKCYDFDNYSMQGLTASKTLRLLKSLPITGLYSDCILALGEADLKNILEFKQELSQIVEYLRDHNIRPLLVSLPQALLVEPAAQQIQELIDETAITYNIDYIYEGMTAKTVSYMVLDDQQMGQAIIALCN